MIPYILFVILILVFRNYRQHQLMLLLLLLFSMLRYNVGWDFMSYYGMVNSWGSRTLTMEHYSFLWSWLFKTAQLLRAPQMAIAIPAFFTIIICYYVIEKIQVLPSRISDSLAIYALWPFFYLNSFSVIRQSLAISIGLLLLYYAIKRKFLPFLLFLILGYFIHQSAAVCVLFAVFFIPNFRLRIWHMVVIVVVFLVACRFLERLVDNSLIGDYLSYVGESDSYGSKLSILIALVTLPVVILRFTPKIKRRVFNMGVIDVVIISFTLTALVYLFVHNSIITRVLDYFVVLFIFVAPSFKYFFRDKKLGSSVVYISFAAVLFVYLIITSGAYSQGLASSPFVPYHTILFR